jgi:hypothetical protein
MGIQRRPLFSPRRGSHRSSEWGVRESANLQCELHFAVVFIEPSARVLQIDDCAIGFSATTERCRSGDVRSAARKRVGGGPI